MNKINIEKLISFFDSKLNEKLLINVINDEIQSFYIFIIFYFARKNNLKLEITQKVSEKNRDIDLFGKRSIILLSTTNNKEIDRLININQKGIILTDYKTLKKYKNNLEKLNGYNYANDIKYFLKIIMKINNDELINICVNSPQLINSETSKYLINGKGYSKEDAIIKSKNFILEVRKDIYEYKKSGNIKKAFFNIKKEAHYKKFSFLTY